MNPQERIRIAQAELSAAHEEVRQAEDAAKRRIIADTIAEHERVIEGATGLRRRILEIHKPTVYRYDLDPPYCKVCAAVRDYEPLFPCETYVLARDWGGNVTEDDDEWPEHTYFVGCTCDHDEDDHGWGSCPCEGGWEE